MQPHKTLQELQTDKIKIETAMSKPGIDAVEMNLYKMGLRRIEEAIVAKKNETAISRFVDPERTKESKIRKLLAAKSSEQASDAAERRPVTPQRPSPKTPLPAPQRQPQHTTPATITAATIAAAKTVAIQWENETIENLTEGEVRSRFWTTLRDLSKSKHAKSERWDEIHRYVTFSRACTYYEALTLFWSEPPTAKQLLITMSHAKEKIFSLIQQNCQHHGTSTE